MRPQPQGFLGPTLETLSRPLDRIRRNCFRLFSPWLNPLFRNKSLRITVIACVFLSVAFAMSMGLPCWQLALGPILLGIPHLLGDIRFLVVRENLHKDSLFWLLVVTPLSLFLLLQSPAYGAGSILGATFLSKKSTVRHAVGLVAMALILLALYNSRAFLYAVLHLHNVIAVAIWWGWNKKRQWWEGITLIVCCLFSMVILFGPIDAFAIHNSHPDLLDPEYFQRTLAPFAAEHLQFRLVMLYAFLQSFHYLIWIKLIPEESSKQPSPQSFKKSLRELHCDLGSYFLLLTGLCMLGLGAWAAFDIESARSNYLWLISFHGFLELAVCAHLVCRGAK